VISSIGIGFGYRARSGKDTAVATIIEARKDRYDVRRYAFADVLKQEVTQAALSAGGMKNLFRDEYYFVNEKGNFVQLPSWVTFETNPDMTDPLCPLGKQRTLLQWWGTEFRRNVNPMYWVKRLSEKIQKEAPEIFLLSDMRFHNEMAFVKEHGETIRVDRASLGPLTANSHASEKELASVPDEEWTRVLSNDGTLEDFKQSAVEAFDTIMEFYPKGYGLV
jgi:hypothetical protein